MAVRGESKRNAVMLSVAKHLDAHAARPFAAAQGDMRTRSCCGSELALNEVNGVTR